MSDILRFFLPTHTLGKLHTFNECVQFPKDFISAFCRKKNENVLQ